MHKDHICLNKFGELFIIASCVYESLEDEASIIDNVNQTEDKKKIKEDFVYESQRKVFGYYTFGHMHVVFILCRNRSE